MTWSETIQAASEHPDLTRVREAIIKQAQTEVKQGLIRRANRLNDIGKHRTWLDGRSNALEREIRETFALAMSDFGACSQLANTLPMVAAAARFTDDARLNDHAIAQLREVSTWSPLQRPGWTLFKPGNRLPKDGKDGNWLATGMGVRGIVNTLEIMEDRIPPDIQKALAELLAKEIAGVVDDWRVKRPWFVRSDNPITNQWVLPNEGLIRACLFLGVDRHRDAYELGVRNLIKALDSHGRAGEFEEGIGYAGFTIGSMLHTARAMAAAGDRRAIDHPFLANFPTWAVHHIQPGRMTVNCFDAGNAQIPRNHGGWRSQLALLVSAGESDVANWAMWEQFDGPPEDLEGLVCRVIAGMVGRRRPPLFAAYERAPMVVWRNHWQDDATGIWVRGGHRLDQHDHQDRGHVNLILRGRPILIEAGTPSYSNPDMGIHYASGAGHNVLQVGAFFPKRPYPVQEIARYPGWQRPHGIAPIEVQRLDGEGGIATVDASRCYDDVESWRREVSWTQERLTVSDRVRLKPGKKDVVLFRWHLGTGQEVKITGDTAGTTVHWSEAEMRFSGSAPIEVLQRKSPDATVAAEDHQHVCLDVRTRKAVQAVDLVMTVGQSRSQAVPARN